MTWCSYWIDPTAVAYEVYLLLTVLGIMAVAYAVAAYGIRNQWISRHTRWVILWAILFRIVLFPSNPILETDWNRYLWDGFVTSQGMNPYQYPPSLFLDSNETKNLPVDEREEVYEVLDKVRYDEQRFYILNDINNATVNTIYPPFTQMLFMAASLTQPFSLMVWRGVILIFDGLLIYSIIKLLCLWNKNPALVIFYAWSPLVLKEYINTTHFDGIALSLFFLGVLMWGKKQSFLSAIIWPASVLTKYFTFPLLFFWIKLPQWKVWGVFVTACILISAPFVQWREESYAGYAHFTQRWESNSSLVSAMEWGYESIGIPAWNQGSVMAEWAGVPFTFDAFFMAKLSGVLIVGCVFLFLLLQIHRKPETDDQTKLKYAFFLIGTILLCSPVANPWYIAWVTPFLCFFPCVSWFYLSLACFVYYLFFTGEQFVYPPWVRQFEYVPFFLILLYESYRTVLRKS